MLKGIIINQDADSFIGGCGDVNATPEAVIAYAKQFANTHVTDYFITLNNTNSTYPSKVMTSLSDKYDRTEENGQAVDYKEQRNVKAAYEHFVKNGYDYIALWCKAFREVVSIPGCRFV